MTKITSIALISLFLMISCKVTVPMYETVTECQDQQAAMWIQDCMKDSKIDSSTSPRLREIMEDQCVRKAKELFCKKVQK